MAGSRRNFLQNATRIAAGVGLFSLDGFAMDPKGIKVNNIVASQAGIVRVGLIGCRNMGWNNLVSLLKNRGVTCTALCDVDRNILQQRAADAEGKWKLRPLLYSDYRELLGNKDIDAVIIATPDHWHCLQMIAACEAGKDVYVEKPIANAIEECKLMVAAAHQYKRVVQVGQWQRSDPHWINALNYLRSGKLGRIRTVRAWAYVTYGKNIAVKPDGTAPEGVNYDMWLGPAPDRPFNPNRFHGNFRYFWDYAGGLMTDWGVHMIDMVLAGMNVTAAASITAIGGKYGYPGSAPETPDTLQAVYDFGDFSMFWEQALGTGTGPYNREAGEPGVAFIGTSGTLIIDRKTWEVIPETANGQAMIEAVSPQTKKSNGLDHHTRNWLECIRSRRQPNCTIEMGANAAINAHLGNIAWRSGAKVQWDKKNGVIINNNQAQQMIKATYRKPWVLPKI